MTDSANSMNPQYCSAATLARAEQMLDILRTRDIGWRLNEQWAAKFLDCVRRQDEWSDDGDSEEMRTVLEWMLAHGQSLDWLWMGVPLPMICGGARAVRIPRPRLRLVQS
jgi:hypothetical protein